jgi:hypothetical protein
MKTIEDFIQEIKSDLSIGLSQSHLLSDSVFKVINKCEEYLREECEKSKKRKPISVAYDTNNRALLVCTDDGNIFRVSYPRWRGSRPPSFGQSWDEEMLDIPQD